MTDSRLQELRCCKCGKKLAEHAIIEGTLRIICNYNVGKGKGPCRTLNVVTVRRKNNNKFSQDVI